MFPRTKTFKNKDGSQRQYLFLVENRKIEGRVKQITVANLGRLDIIAPKLGELIEKLSKFAHKIQVIDLAQEMVAEWTKEYGPVLIFQKLWEELQLDGWLRHYQGKSKHQFDVSPVIFAMVLNRLLEPHSELGTHEWIKSVYGFPEINLNHWYRAIDFLIEHKEQLEQDLFAQLKNLFNQEVDMVLLDTTSVMKAVQITLREITYILRTELQGQAYLAFKVLGIRPPNRILFSSLPPHKKVVVRQG